MQCSIPAGYDISVYPISTKEDRRTFFENLPIRRTLMP